MEVFIKWVSEYINNAWFQGFFFLILSLFLAWIFNNKQKPRYAVTSNTIITNYISNYRGLEIRFEDSIISNLTETTVYFWNDGGKSIRKNDLLVATPLQLHIPNRVDIYRVEYIATTDLDKTIQFNHSDENCLEISFEAMQKDDGVCFKILHSIKENNSICVKGQLDNRIEIKKNKNKKILELSYKGYLDYFWEKTLLITYLFVSNSIIIFGKGIVTYDESYKNNHDTTEIPMIMVVLLISFLIGFLIASILTFIFEKNNKSNQLFSISKETLKYKTIHLKDN